MRLSPSRSATGVAIATLFLLEKAVSFQTIHTPVRTQNRWLPEQRVKVMQRSHVSSQLSFSGLPEPSRPTLTSQYAANFHIETDPSPKKTAALQLWSRLSLLRMYAKRVLRRCRQTVATLAFSVLLVFSCHSNAAWAVSGGRMGGSFGATSRSYSSSSLGTSSRSVPMGQYHPNAGPRMHMHAHLGPSSRMYGSRENFPGDTSIATRFSPSDIALLTTTTIVLAYGFTNKKRLNGENSPLGPGATVASLTLSLDAQNRNDPDCLLNRLKSISEKFDTSHRKGVQDLVAAVALELLRHEDNIVSAQANSEQFSTVSQAERQFQRLSVQGRSKLDRETVNKFGNANQPDVARMASSDVSEEPDSSSLTNAVVSIKLSIEGDSTRMPNITYRQNLRDALERIASDAQVEDCLVSAEILWSPEEKNDRLTSDEIYASYPDLIPL